MATYKLYDIGTVSDSTYMYKGVYRVGTQLSSVTSYELMIFRFNLSDGAIDPNYGQQQQGAFRANFQIKPTVFPVDPERLCPGLMFDENDELTFAGIAWMSGLARHGFFIAKLDNTGNLSQYGSGNFGISTGGFDTNMYSCTKELLVDKNNNCIFGASTREYVGDVDSPSYISRRNSSGDLDSTFGNNGKVKIEDANFKPQITSLTFDNYGNYYVGYNALKNDGTIFGNSYIKSYNYSGNENTYFATNGQVVVDPGANFAAEAPQDLGSVVRDQYLDDVKVFLTMNGEDGATSISDVVGGETVSFIGNAKISTDNKKFGASSLRLDGTNNSYLQIGTNGNPSDIPFANEDFCVEAMLYLDALDDSKRVLSLGGNTSTTGLLIETLNSGDNLNAMRVMMGTHTGGNSNVVNLVANDCLSAQNWHHFAYVRKDNNVYLYVDGELRAAAGYEGSVNLGTSGSLKLGSDQNGENGFIGYIDDFRVTIGNSRYFNNFKVPEHQISNVGPSSDVKLLLHFEGDNNSKTIVDRGITKIATASCLGNAEISSDNHKFGETSLKLDGVNSVVEVPDSKINWPTSFYTSPFTIEGYFYFNDVSKTQVMIKKNNSITMQYDNQSGLKFLSVTLTDTNNTTTRFKQLPWEPVANRWYHIAFVKNGINVGLYVDGQRLVNASYLNTLQDGGSTNSPWDIGGNRAGSADYFDGYIDEVRIVASAVYTDTFTPAHHQFFPTQEHAITSNDNYQDQNKLLLHFEEADGSSLVDSSNNDTGVSMESGSLNSSNARFGSKSLYVPSSGKGANVAGLVSNASDIGAGGIDYTIEMYFKLEQVLTNAVLVTSDSATQQHMSLVLTATGMELLLKHDADTTTMNFVEDLETNKWYHVAVVRNNNEVKLYLDGVSRATSSASNSTTINGPFVLGKDLDGYIDEVRITDGVARYTANFTPQTSAFGSEPVAVPEPQYNPVSYDNSKLLLHFDDVSSNALSSPVDSSGDNKTVSVNTLGSGSNTSGRNSNTSKFGGQSWRFNTDGSSGNHIHLSVNNNDLIIGTNDFTIDMWIYESGSNSGRDQRLIQYGDNNQLYIKISSTGVLEAYLDSGSGTPVTLQGPNMMVHNGKWTHIALVRSSGAASLYVNGDSVATNATAGHDLNGGGVGFYRIGGNTQNNEYFSGYMDEVHIRNSAVYTVNFTVPAYAYGKQPVSYTEPTPYFKAKSELAYMLPLTQTSSFLAVAKKTNSDNTTYAEVLNVKHQGQLLTTWGSNGKVALTVPGYAYSEPEAMWMDRELNLYVAGSAKKISNGQKDGVVWKLMSSGAVDATFGSNSGVDIINNTSLDESITSMYNDYDNNKMIFTSLFTGDSGTDTNVPVMVFDQYNFSGDLTFLSSYNYITKETTPAEGLNRVLQDMGLTNAAHIKMPASLFNNLFKDTFDEGTQRFATDNITLTVDQSANDNITVVSGGLIKDFWNYFVAQIENLLPADKRSLWDDSPTGANAYTNAKLQTFFRDVGLGTLTVPNVNDVIREYEANSVSLFPHRVQSNGSPYHRREGFIAGDKAGINAGVQITFQTTITAATGGTASDTVISETRTFNVLLELE